MQFHEVAEIFPLMEGAAFDALVADIKQHGLLEPVWTLDGKIIDGRNRFRACEAIGITPKIRPWTGDDPVDFVLSMNLHRRQMTKSQCALAAAKAVKLQRGGDRGNQYTGGKVQTCTLPLDDAAKAFGVSRSQVCNARKVLAEAASEVIAEVASGKRTVYSALGTVRPHPPKKKQKRETVLDKTRGFKRHSRRSQIQRASAAVLSLDATIDMLAEITPDWAKDDLDGLSLSILTSIATSIKRLQSIQRKLRRKV